MIDVFGSAQRQKTTYGLEYRLTLKKSGVPSMSRATAATPTKTLSKLKGTTS